MNHEERAGISQPHISNIHLTIPLYRSLNCLVIILQDNDHEVTPSITFWVFNSYWLSYPQHEQKLWPQNQGQELPSLDYYSTEIEPEYQFQKRNGLDM
jgi:hypothetical protein